MVLMERYVRGYFFKRYLIGDDVGGHGLQGFQARGSYTNLGTLGIYGIIGEYGEDGLSSFISCQIVCGRQLIGMHATLRGSIACNKGLKRVTSYAMFKVWRYVFGDLGDLDIVGRLYFTISFFTIKYFGAGRDAILASSFAIALYRGYLIIDVGGLMLRQKATYISCRGFRCGHPL